MTPCRKVVVTGGAGFIGTHLCRRLRAEGHSVVGLDNGTAQVHGDRAAGPGAADGVVHADVRDAEAVSRAVAGADVLYHLAADTGVGQSQYEIARYAATNTLGTAVVLQAAVDAGVEHVVLASSRAVYGEGPYRCPRCEHRFSAPGRRAVDLEQARWEAYCPRCTGPAESLPISETDVPSPTSIYGVTKLHQEELARAVSSIHGLPVTILRLFNVFGPGQSLHNPYAGVLGRFFRQAQGGSEAELYEDGRMSRDFVFIDDVVDVLGSVLVDGSARGATMNVGTGVRVTLGELAAELFSCLGTEPRLTVTGRYRVGDVRHSVADTTRLASTLGFRPGTSLRQGLAAYVDWARAQPADAADQNADAELTARALLRWARP